jgi:uncharacterized protein YraI
MLVGGLLAGFALPAPASAQTALVTTELNMRAGPSPEFPVVATLPENAHVRVHGCLDGYNWCDVSWQDERGWAYGAYLSYPYDNRYVVVSEYGPEIDLPIVTYSVGSYWDRYYRGRPWYGTRSRWIASWRDDDRRDRRGYGYRTWDSERVDRTRRERDFSGDRRDRIQRGDRVDDGRNRARAGREFRQREERQIRTGERLDRRDGLRERSGEQVPSRSRGDAAVGGGRGTPGGGRGERGGDGPRDRR